MKELLDQIKNEASREIEKSSNLELLENTEKKYLGRQDGEITKILRKLKDLSLEEKRVIGSLANEIKTELQEKIKNQKIKFNFSSAGKSSGDYDITLPGKKVEIGHLHPLTQFLKKVEEIFISMGFEIVEGPELETEEYNFDLLNIPEDHPARDLWDTFYINDQELKTKSLKSNLLLRTHTSPVQLRAMKTRKPPVRLVAPGRVFRHEATDAGHETTFYQLEGLVIDKGIKMTDLIGTLKAFTKSLYGEKTEIRVRSSFFPFTEPSIEVDMSCLICGGKGCSACGGDGWVEILGAGMVNPKVLKNMKIDPDKYTGFAFGMGIDRLMMLYYGVHDVRFSYSGDLRFIKQF